LESFSDGIYPNHEGLSFRLSIILLVRHSDSIVEIILKDLKTESITS